MQKALQISFFFFFFFSLSSVFLDSLPKVFLAKVLRLVTKEVCDQDLTHSLDTPKNIFVKMVPEIVIHDVYGT